MIWKLLVVAQKSWRALRAPSRDPGYRHAALAERRHPVRERALRHRLRPLLMERFPRVRECQARYGEFGEGDVRHSQADISKARRFLAYAPTHRVGESHKEELGWYLRNLSRQS